VNIVSQRREMDIDFLPIIEKAVASSVKKISE
jgi:hypothetical protein